MSYKEAAERLAGDATTVRAIEAVVIGAWGDFAAACFGRDADALRFVEGLGTLYAAQCEDRRRRGQAEWEAPPSVRGLSFPELASAIERAREAQRDLRRRGKREAADVRAMLLLDARAAIFGAWAAQLIRDAAAWGTLTSRAFATILRCHVLREAELVPGPYTAGSKEETAWAFAIMNVGTVRRYELARIKPDPEGIYRGGPFVNPFLVFDDFASAWASARALQIAELGVCDDVPPRVREHAGPWARRARGWIGFEPNADKLRKDMKSPTNDWAHTFNMLSFPLYHAHEVPSKAKRRRRGVVQASRGKR